jgi:hypothetical protein
VRRESAARRTALSTASAIARRGRGGVRIAIAKARPVADR